MYVICKKWKRSCFSDGVVSLNEYTSFMISRETENVRSSSEVEDAFRAITDGGKQPFVTEHELYSVCFYFISYFVQKNYWNFNQVSSVITILPNPKQKLLTIPDFIKFCLVFQKVLFKKMVVSKQFFNLRVGS